LLKKKKFISRNKKRSFDNRKCLNGRVPKDPRNDVLGDDRKKERHWRWLKKEGG